MLDVWFHGQIVCFKIEHLSNINEIRKRINNFTASQFYNGRNFVKMELSCSTFMYDDARKKRQAGWYQVFKFPNEGISRHNGF